MHGKHLEFTACNYSSVISSAFTQINKTTEILLLCLLDQCVDPHYYVVMVTYGGRKGGNRRLHD